MIALSNVDQSVSLELDIVGYQFPEQADDWCLVRVCVTQGEERFEHVDPALEAGELEQIRDWFEALLHNQIPRYTALSFTEPCLQFELLGREPDGRIRLIVRLDVELKPPFNLRQMSYDFEDDWGIVFLLDHEQLAGVQRRLHEWSLRFPRRRA